MKDETYSERIAREDALVKEMEEKLGQPWETAVLDLVNAPAAHALDHLWREIIYTQHGEEYGDWEYPGQAYRHLKAEYDELRAENGRLRAELDELEAELAHLPTDVSAQNYVAYSEQTIKTLLDALWPFAKAHQESVEWYDAFDRVGERDFVNARKMYSGIKGE